MRYSGNITILDENGEVVFERELDADSMIELLLAGEPEQETEEAEQEEEPVPQARGGRKKSTCGLCQEMGHNSKTCPQNPDALHGREVGKRKDGIALIDEDILTERQFKDIKESVKHDMNALEIANEMNLPIGAVNSAISAANYDWYRSHA